MKKTTALLTFGALTSLLFVSVLPTFAVVTSPSLSPPTVDSQPGCTYLVPNGAIVNPESGQMLLANHTLVSLKPAYCQAVGGLTSASSVSGNAAYGQLYISSGHYTSFSDYWAVPSAPSSGSFSNGQSVEFYDGLYGKVGSYVDIVQAVLVYGCPTPNQQGQCPSYWQGIDYAGIQGVNYISSTSIKPSVGDTIYGGVALGSSSTCPSGGPMYSIEIGDATTSAVVTFTVCSTDQFGYGVAGSLEIHSLSTCSQAPGWGYLYFSSISYSDSSQASPTYSTHSDVTFCSAAAGPWYHSNTELKITWTYT